MTRQRKQPNPHHDNKTSLAILDASALICFARRERGWEQVANHGTGCDISSVNYVEVIARLANHGMTVIEIENALSPLFGEVVPFNREQAILAAALHGETRAFGLSLADCCCLALSRWRGCRVITADRQWSRLPLGLDIVQIR